jgi:hypothetical protein
MNSSHYYRPDIHLLLNESNMRPEKYVLCLCICIWFFKFLTVLLEKILRVQPNVKKIYLLLRAADAKAATHRFHNEVLIFCTFSFILIFLFQFLKHIYKMPM